MRQTIVVLLLLIGLWITAYSLIDQKMIGFDKLDSFPVEVSNCDIVICTMHDIEGNELWSIEVEKASYSEFIKQMGKIYNIDLVVME